MDFSRRGALVMGGAAVFVSLVPIKTYAASPAVDAAIKAFAGDNAVVDGVIELTTPEIAENGNTVPVSFNAPGAKRVMLLAEGNPLPGVAEFEFSELAPAAATTRIRLAKTQNVIAVAEMTDGTYAKAANTVKVTIGGCGG